MSFLLALLAFALILIGVQVTIGHHSAEAKIGVGVLTGFGALAFLLFATKVYFS